MCGLKQNLMENVVLDLSQKTVLRETLRGNSDLENALNYEFNTASIKLFEEHSAYLPFNRKDLWIATFVFSKRFAKSFHSW